MGDVQAAEAHPAGPRARSAPTLLGRQAEVVDVDQLVDVAEAERVGLALVQLRAERRADARADEADEVPRFTGDHLLDDLSRADVMYELVS